MDKNFEVGDVVKLKSGGSSMTVEHVSDDNVSCVWHEGKKTHRDTFNAKTLVHYKLDIGGITLSRG